MERLSTVVPPIVSLIRYCKVSLLSSCVQKHPNQKLARRESPSCVVSCLSYMVYTYQSSFLVIQTAALSPSMVPINRPNHEPNVTCVKGHVAVVHGNLRATARAEKSLGDTGGLPFVQGGLQLSFEQRWKTLMTYHYTWLVA